MRIYIYIWTYDIESAKNKVKLVTFADADRVSFFSGELTSLLWLERMMQPLVSFCQTNGMFGFSETSSSQVVVLLVCVSSSIAALRQFWFQLKIEASDCSDCGYLWYLCAHGCAVDCCRCCDLCWKSKCEATLIKVVCEANNIKQWPCQNPPRANLKEVSSKPSFSASPFTLGNVTLTSRLSAKNLAGLLSALLGRASCSLA